MKTRGAAITPWLARPRPSGNLLIDLTGNTHRTGNCASTRPLIRPGVRLLPALVLVELRACSRNAARTRCVAMSLTQQLLVRALIAHFWQCPWARRLVPWGTALHDRFMLPHFIERDFEDVLEELNDADIPSGWNGSGTALRVPLPCHRIHYKAGDSSGSPGCVGALERAGRRGVGRRYGALCRFFAGAVAGEGFRPDRHAVCRLCNRRRVPLHPTGTPGEFGAGFATAPGSRLRVCIPISRCIRRWCLISWTHGRGVPPGLHVSCIPPLAAGRTNSFQ